MKKFYFALVAMVAAFISFSQTSPTPQAIPYSQDFSTLTHSSTTYPAGWQGWTVSTSPSAIFNTSAPTADRTLVSNSTASVNSGNVHNYNGKIGFLNTGSLDLSLILALDGSGKSSIQVNYDIMTIRNPYDGTSNTRINEVTLQYRIGNTGSFTTLMGIEYQNNTTTQTTAVTTPQNSQSKSITLPSACDNQSNIQIRWISRQVSGSGSRPSFAVDNISITATGGGADVTPPTVSSLSPSNGAIGITASSTATINFSETIQKGTGNVTVKRTSDNSIVQTIDVTTAAVTVSGSSASFALSGLAPSTAYYIEIDNGAFKDVANNNFAGFTGNSTWAFTTSNSISTIFSANFNTCVTGSPGTVTDGFTRYSVTGPHVWDCTTFGRSGNGTQINGYDNSIPSNVANVDWLISPAMNLSSSTFPLLSFWSRTRFNGGPLQLKVSTNYSGSGDPNLATWTDLNGKFPAQTSDVWTQSSNINLTAFKQAAVYIAFVYTSTNEEGARWTLDDIQVDNSATAPPATVTTSTSDIQFTYVASGSTADKTFQFTGNDITTDVTLTATGAFQLSKDGTSFSSSINYTLAEANNITKTVYVRFAPTSPGQNFNGTITISTSGLNPVINVKGTSIDPANTLEVVNWNIEWFGDAGNGPTNDTQQEQNVRTILQNIGADIYGLTEIVSETRLASVVSQMPGYAYVIGNFGSHVNPPDPAGGSVADAQKLAFVYKTSVFSNVSTRPLINNQNISSTSYNSWSSGRYPFLMKADVTLNGQTRTVNFVLIHGKANTSPTTTSYNRRKAASDELRDTLMTYFATANVIVLGDFNDDLDATIADGITPPTTSYSAFTSDNVNFFAPTLALSQAGKKSTVSYNDMIDHVIVSNELQSSYMSSTASVLTDVTALVTNYASTTSDHYPVFTRFLLTVEGSLPVKLITFNAVKDRSNVKLTWSTSEEVNAKEFAIERSADGRRFETIGTVSAAGNSTVTVNYSFTDNRPASGNNFYRLRIIDRDQKVELSRIVRIDFNKTYTITLAPNPAKFVINVNITNASEPVQLQIIDVSGKVVKSQLLTAASNRVEIAGLAKGLYLVRMKGTKETYTEKLVIE